MSLSVYFFCSPYESPERAAYQHLAICIAEGLTSLGVRVFSNIDYWKTEDGYLFKHDPDVRVADCDVVVISDAWFEVDPVIPAIFSLTSRAYRTVYLDSQDGARLFSHDRRWTVFDFILKTHFVDDTSLKANFHPWSFGLSDRMLKATAAEPQFERNGLLVNFRHTRYPHSVRLAVHRHLIPKIRSILDVDERIDIASATPDANDLLSWEQTGRRHSSRYYDRLRRARACGAFGGYFISMFPRSTAAPLSRAIKSILTRSGLQTHRIVQWDSWRLWEAMAAGCAPFHVDFERYSCRFPVAPTNWNQYIGFDLSDPQPAIDRIASDPTILEKIGSEARAWSRQHYSPVPTAKRFLATVGLDTT